VKLDATNETRPWILLPILIVLAALAAGCKGTAQPQPSPPPEVSVIQVNPGPVTVYDEYVAQTQAPDTIEIRARVTGLLERQAFVDGARVKKGALLYVIDPRPFELELAQAKANLAQGEANLSNAKQNRERYERLVAQGMISRQAYDNAVTQERANAATVEAQRAQVRNAELNLDYTRLRTPRDGFMSSSLVQPGALITAQQTLLTTLYSSDPMWVLFGISEDKLLELQKRLKHPPGEHPETAPPFHIRLADGTEYNFPGRLNFVDAAIDQKTGTLQVRISVPNPERFLRPGLFVRVVVPAFQNPNAIRIPQQAVQELQGLKSVYVVNSANQVESRQIVASLRIGHDWVVDSGLSPGDKVVVEGVGKLRPGAPVRAVMAASEAGPANNDGAAPRLQPATPASAPVAAKTRS
jgi:membrane fusion protein (multidrug efflux system)